jgi:hypothetical protein
MSPVIRRPNFAITIGRESLSERGRSEGCIRGVWG